jgi:predicted nuclease of predicted toxin-antitoxin system
VSWLRSAGYDVVHLRDEGLQRLTDDQILVKARTEGRILLTVDKRSKSLCQHTTHLSRLTNSRFWKCFSGGFISHYQ